MKIVNLVKKQVADSKRRMGEGALSLGEMLAQGLQVMVPGVGAGISLALGKLVLGDALALVCLCVVVRLTLRRKNVPRVTVQGISFSQKNNCVFIGTCIQHGFCGNDPFASAL